MTVLPPNPAPTAEPIDQMRTLLAAGRGEEALALARAAAAAAPGDVPLLKVLGGALVLTERREEALAVFEKVAELAPADQDNARNHAAALLHLGRPSEARDAYDALLAKWPDDDQARVGRDKADVNCRAQARRCNDAGGRAVEAFRFAEAEWLFERACRLAPDFGFAHNNHAILLQQMGRLAEAEQAFRRVLRLRPRDPAIGSNFLTYLNYVPGIDADLRSSCESWAARHAPPRPRPRPADPDPERVLRLGYVSPDLGQHPVGQLLAGVLPAHDRTRVHVTVYQTSSHDDDVTRQLRAATDVWHCAAGWSDDRLEAAIRADAIDILVDLAGHTADNSLMVFAGRPAPVQISWLGWFHTTGMAAIDAIIMDPHTVPADLDEDFTERVVRLPNTRFCYSPPAYAPPVQPPPCLARGYVTFGSFNNTAKLNPRVIALWARLLARLPRARLLLKWKTFADQSLRDRFAGAFAAHGIEPQRLEFRPRSSHARALAEYGDIDIALDPFPFGGGYTSADALWMGVPVVTWPGRRPASRQTHAFLANIGLTGPLSAESARDYLDKAAALAGEPARLAALRHELRPRLAASPVTDGRALAGHLDVALRQLWREIGQAE